MMSLSASATLSDTIITRESSPCTATGRLVSGAVVARSYHVNVKVAGTTFVPEPEDSPVGGRTPYLLRKPDGVVASWSVDAGNCVSGDDGVFVHHFDWADAQPFVPHGGSISTSSIEVHVSDPVTGAPCGTSRQPVNIG